MITAPLETPQKTERLLEKSGRITPREVLEAYEATGLRPLFRNFRNGDKACALRVIYHATNPDEGGYLMWVRDFCQKTEDGYFTGFVSGFDNEPGLLPSIGWRKGYRDGQRVRRFVIFRYSEAR